MSVNGTHDFEREKKTYTDKTKLNLVAHDDTLRSKDTKQSEQYLYSKKKTI